MKIITLCMVVWALPLWAQKHIPASSSPLAKSAVQQWKFLSLTAINAAVASDGPFIDYRPTGSAGLEWPKASGKKAVFSAGIKIGGIHRPTDSIRFSGIEYGSEFQPGPLLETFSTLTNDDEGPVSRAPDIQYRLYKVRKRDKHYPEVNADYVDWPVDQGAPWADRDGDGVWNPEIDEPLFYGDEQIWSVVNDVSVQRHKDLSNSLPMGVEIRSLYSVMNTSLAAGNMMVIRWTIINKSDAAYDSVYVGVWSDVDLGDPSDDLPGCDTTLNLAFVYNGDDFDGTAQGYGNTPPAVGFKFLWGPQVPAAESDSAYNGREWKPGWRNLPMSAFIINVPDPPTPPWIKSGSKVFYNELRGIPFRYQSPIPDSLGNPMVHLFTGDPVAGTGNLPHNFPLGRFSPQDFSMLSSSGPFTLEPGDTQQVGVLFLVAQAVDRFASITKLKDLAAWVIPEDFDHAPVTPLSPLPPPSAVPLQFRLDQNYPNPFNGGTVIPFEVSEPGKVRLEVYSLLGQRVRVILNAEVGAGPHTVPWDGTDDAGRFLSSGMYYYRLTAGTLSLTRPAVILR